jgi:hypothetical protein
VRAPRRPRRASTTLPHPRPAPAGEGLAEVVRHRGDDERAGDYDELLAREEAAKAAKKGLFSGKPPAAAKKIADWTAPAAGAAGDAAARARGLLAASKGKTLKATVDFVYSGAARRAAGLFARPPPSPARPPLPSPPPPAPQAPASR